MVMKNYLNAEGSTEPFGNDSAISVEPIFKRYTFPNGEVLELTKSEFDQVVDLFRRLDTQDRRLAGEKRLKQIISNTEPST